MATGLPKLNQDLIARLEGSGWYKHNNTKHEIARCIEALKTREATWLDRLSVSDIVLMCHSSEDVYRYTNRIIGMPQKIGIHGDTKTSNF